MLILRAINPAGYLGLSGDGPDARILLLLNLVLLRSGLRLAKGRERLSFRREELAGILHKVAALDESCVERSSNCTSHILHSSLPDSAVTSYWVPQALHIKKSKEPREVILAFASLIAEIVVLLRRYVVVAEDSRSWKPRLDVKKS